MRVHHLNTGTMCPIGRRLVNGTGSIFQRARMVCHCLLIETNDGLALVDTGIGLDDIANPPRLGPKWVRQTTPRLDPAEVVREQRLEQVARRRPLDLDLPHVRDVEDARVRADHFVLLDHALVLDRHLPARERDHPGAEDDVTVVERRAAKRLHRGRC